MALKFFDEDQQSKGNGQLAFLNDWLEENPKNKETNFLITEIKRVQSGKGYMAITDKFAVFLWKNSKITKLLIEALEFWVENPDKGYGLFVVLKKPNKPDYVLASDTDLPTTWFTSKNGYTTTQDDAFLSIEESSGNPFL